MIVEYTKRLICKTEMNIVEGVLIPSIEQSNSEINILDLKPSTGMEYGFMFYDKSNEEFICQIHFEDKRRSFEISYGTDEKFREKGYMTEALEFFVNWIFEHTIIQEMFALINDNPISQHILENRGFEFYKQDENGDWFIIRR